MHVNGGPTPDTADSGVAVDTTGRKLEIYYDYAGSTVHYYIDGAEVCSGISQTNRPGSGYNLRYVVTLRTTENVSKNIRVGWVFAQVDK